MNTGSISEYLAAAMELVRDGVRHATGDSLDDAVTTAGELYRFEQQIIAELLSAAAVITERVEIVYPEEILEGVSVASLAGDQLAKKVGISCRFGKQFASLGIESFGRLAPAWEALARGELDYRKFKAIDRKTAILDDEKALQVQEKVLPGAFTRTARGFSDQLARHVLRADPDAARKREKTVYENRGVECFLEDDGQAVIMFRGPVHEIRSAWNVLCHQAKLLTRDGRTLDNKAFDIGIDKLISNLTGPTQRTTVLNVNVSLPSLLGLDKEPGDIDGGGPVSASIIKEISKDENVHLRRILTDEHGNIIDISNKYRPTPKQRAKAGLRQQRCAVPGCNHPATACDLDHRDPYRVTGTTNINDMAFLCRRHHLYKHLGILSWKRHDNHRIEITYRTRPEDFPDEPTTRSPKQRRQRKPPPTPPTPICPTSTGDTDDCPF